MVTVKSLSLSPGRGNLKKSVDSASFRSGYGIVGDSHAGDWHRQISLLSEFDIQALDQTVTRSGIFAENIVITNLDFSTIGVGTRLQLGDDVVLSITQAGKDLHPHANLVRVSGDHIMARTGLYAHVEHGGEVHAGDHVKIIDLVPRNKFQAVVLTISDRCSRGENVDTAGPAVENMLLESLNARIYHAEIIPDVKALISKKLIHFCDDHAIDLLFTVGGTGPAPRDVTPEATRAVVERFTPGFDEAMRYASLEKTATAILSRGASGIRGTTFIVNLPGSERAAVENLEAIIQALPHGIRILRGHPAGCGCCSAKPTAQKTVTQAS